MLSSLGENILFADADGSTDFEALNKFESFIGKGTEDVLICGSRCHLKSDTEAVVKVRQFQVKIRVIYILLALHF